MLHQLMIGSLVVVSTVVVCSAFAWGAIQAEAAAARWLARPPRPLRLCAVIAALVLWIQLAMTVCVWIWATVFLMLGIFADLEASVYFSLVAFTTLGFGDILLPPDWRILSGLAAANGLLMFGFFTAFIVEMLRRVRQAQASTEQPDKA